MSQLKVNEIVDANGGNNAVLFGVASPPNSMGFRNRIINGNMVIDQRNNGASVATSSGSLVYTLDRWRATYTQTSRYTVQQNAASVTPPTGFQNYLGVTSVSAYSVTSSDFFFVNQRIEGFNVGDLGWGTAAAATVTLSFLVRSSLTGTFGGSLRNAANNRSYPFSYTILAANTWEQKAIIIAGDTSGTWLTNNGIGIDLGFGLGVGSAGSGTANSWSGSALYAPTGATSVVGTNGATFYITGVQLEAGSVATPFERRPYGTELALCQRYFQTTYNTGTALGTATGTGTIQNQAQANVAFINMTWQAQVKMRATPTVTNYSPQTGTAGRFYTNAPAGDYVVSAGFLGDSNVTVTTGAQSITATAYVATHFACSSEL